MRRVAVREDADPAQDSFLDVVTNIVGILIILVMVIGARVQHLSIKSAAAPPPEVATLAAEAARLEDAVVLAESDLLELDEQAAQLPNRYEPLMAEAEIDLWQLVEEELLLFLPSYSYHGDTECGRQVGLAVQDDGLLVGREIDGPEKQNPFDILASLKSDDQGLNTK